MSELPFALLVFALLSLGTSADTEKFLAMLKIRTIVAPTLVGYALFRTKMLAYLLICRYEGISVDCVQWGFYKIRKNRHQIGVSSLQRRVVISVPDLKGTSACLNHFVEIAFLDISHY